MLAAAVLLLAAAGFGIWGLASKKPSPLKDAALTAMRPLQKGCTAVAAWFSSVGRYMDGVDALQAENEELRAQISELSDRVRRAEALEDENAELRTLLGMRKRYEEYDLASAEVTGTETGSWGYRYLLDVGTADGVEAGQCVIANECLVGWIAEAGEYWSSMETIVSSNLRAGAVVTRTHEVGVLLGSYTLSRSGRFSLEYLPDNPSLEPGDAVETSGAGGGWPAGFLVGTVESVSLSSDGMGTSAVIAPACDLTSLERVYVIRSFTVGER